MSADHIKRPAAEDAAAELHRLRNEVVTQAKELAVMRWEISALMRQRPVSGQVNRIKFLVQRRFPKCARLLGLLSRTLRMAATRVRSRSAPRLAMPRDNDALLAGPILFIGESAVARRIAAARPAVDVLQLEQGAGFTRSLTVAQTNEPALRGPAEGSFVKWLSEDTHRLRGYRSIVVNAGDEIGLALLRGRLTVNQTLALTNMPEVVPAAPALVAELGPSNVTDAALSYYTTLPVDWLDPLDDQDQPVSATLPRSWPKISVVMVSFNQASFLEEGILSVLEQGYPDLEFIVIDGNSKDGSIEILERYRDRLSVLVIEADRGQSDGLNKGFQRASGEIITWVNSDDLLEPGALFRVAQAFSAYGVDMVAGGCRQIGLSREKVILDHHNRLPFGLPVALPLGLLLEMNRFWLTGSFFYQPEVFFSRDIWLRSGGKLRTDLNYVLDYDLWVRMAAAGATIVHIPEFLACSRTHDQQKTTVGMPYMPEVQNLLREYSNRLISTP